MFNMMWKIIAVLVSILNRPYQITADYAGYRAVDGDCPGSDMKTVNVTEAECATQCTSAPECDGWVYISQDTDQWPDTPCFLKRMMCWKPLPRMGSIYKSYYKEIGDEVAGYKSTSGDCISNDIGFESTGTPQICGALCTSMPQCAGFLYVRSGTLQWSNPPCILKNRMCEKPSQSVQLQFTAYFQVDEGMTVFQESSTISLTPNPGEQAVLIYSQLECAIKCHRDPGCTDFSVSENGGKYSCDMTSSMQLPTPAPPTTPFYKKQSVIKS